MVAYSCIMLHPFDPGRLPETLTSGIDVELRMPRFRVSGGGSMVEALKALGSSAEFI